MRMRNCISCGDWLAEKEREKARKNGGLCEKCAAKGGHEETRIYVRQRFGSDRSPGDLPATSPLMKELARQTASAPADPGKPKGDAPTQVKAGPSLPRQIPTPPFPPKGQARTAHAARSRVVILHFCTKCDRRLSDADILFGRPRHRQGDLICCGDCARAATAQDGENGKGLLGIFGGTKAHRQSTGHS